jgi:hypothetical protein
LGTTPAEGPTPAFAARPRTVLALLIGGLAAAGVGFTLDQAGRLLLSVVALVLIGEGVALLLLRPVLRAGPDGVTTRIGLRSVSVPWSEVGTVQARRARRLITGDTVEIELGERLVVLAVYRLGAPAELVAATVEAIRPISR